MNNELEPRRERTPEQKYGDLIESIAKKELTRIFTGPDGARAAAQIALSFRGAVSQAENPGALLACSPISIAMCVSNSARFRILPGGSNPGVYLVPKGGMLGWWLNHRGMCTLAERSGKHLDVKPVYTFDSFEYAYGLNPTLSHVPGKCPEGKARGWDTLAGVYVIVRDAATGRALDFLFMDRDEIARRKASAGTQKVWNQWPVEQSMKTAIKYTIARGMVVLDEEAREALAFDAEASEVADVIDSTATIVPQRMATQRLDAVLGIAEDTVPPVDYAAENARMAEREAVPVTASVPPTDPQPTPEPAAPIDPIAVWALAIQERTGVPAAVVVDYCGVSELAIDTPDARRAVSLKLLKDGSQNADLLKFAGTSQ